MGVRIVKLPDIGEGVAEAEIVEWHVKEGDEVAEDQVLAAVMTDKATVEIPSPVAGRVSRLAGEVGEVIPVGSQLVTIETEGGAAASAASGEIEEPIAPDMVAEKGPAAGDDPHAGAAAEAEPARSQGKLRPSASDQQPSVARQPGAASKAAGATRGATSGPPRPEGEKPLASPAVRGRALQAGIDLRQVRGSGPAGRISHEDLDAFLSGGGGGAARAVRNETVEEIKVAGLRRRIAERMADSTRRVAHFAYVEEVDVTALEELRAALNAEDPEGRPKLTLLPFVVKALAVAIRDFPQMNAHYEDEANIVTRYGALHAGIATQTPNGLMVPVLGHAEARDLWDMASEIKRISSAARDGSASREELTGSTITITSLGELGGIVTTPVINRPEVAIIGINKIAIRPVWRDNQFVPRKIMNLSSSFDHRVVDGYDAALFIQRIRKLLEVPAMLFMEP